MASSAPAAGVNTLPSDGKEAPRSFARRDRLREIEKSVQANWAANKEFECDAPSQASYEGGEKPAKFMTTFPYPYMNGRLHLGHAFTVTKADFQAGYQRLKGKRVLFPFAFHCTGMPIQAAANKLKRELDNGIHLKKEAAAAGDAMDVEPAMEPASPDPSPVAAPPAEAPAGEAKMKELGKFSGKKTKAVAKGAGGGMSQYDILVKSGLPADEIPAFSDPMHWLGYFPPLGQEDLSTFGLHADWRRSFITTDVNPYYDSFIQWQFRTLKARDRLGFGKRPTVFSPLDGQACADHDRASGEGVNPQEYTLVKLKLQGVPSEHPHAAGALAPLAALLASGSPVFFTAATLRPETMYGQTNCFLLPEGTYGAFRNADGSIFICTERSARNMSYQGFTVERGVPVCEGSFQGEHLLGLPLSAPYAAYETVYTLPLMTISMKKGTGVVTSVPSDAPDDWAALRDLQQKPALREKYGLTEAMASFDVVEIIDIPGFGKRAAVTVCDELKIKSQNDKEKLAEAKDRVYMAGFYQGTLLVGAYAGRKVCDAKPLVRADMMAAGLAAVYFEPESVVMSRSGDECVVAELDQWYLKYGDEEWREAVSAWVTSPAFATFNPAAQAMFESTLAWLKEWACSRNFGLGTRVPWDPQFVIESLSDSTIYMAYYTVAHLLQGDMYGATPGPLGIAPGSLNDAVWDFIFQEGPYPADCGIPEAKLTSLRDEFTFWYPLDLRVSGKDLITNHLTMALYNHAAMWPDRFGDRMPRGFFTNGHVLVDGEKMSKSLGNFIILKDAVARWGADATRFALADAGDGLDDANFERETADSAILRLTTEEEYLRETLAAGAAGKLRGGPLSYADRVMAARLDSAITATASAYEAMRYRDALRNGFYALQLDRDAYRDMCAKLDTPVHADVIRRFFEVQYVLLAPICPHLCEHVWRDLLQMTHVAPSVTRAPWPSVSSMPAVEASTLIATDSYLQAKLHSFRVQISKAVNGKPGKAPKAAPATKPNHVAVYVATHFAPWQEATLRLLASLYDSEKHPREAGYFPPDSLNAVKALVLGDAALKPRMKAIMEFANLTILAHKERSPADGPSPALRLAVPFDEASVWGENAEYVRKALDIANVHVLRVEDEGVVAADPSGRAKDVVPGEPAVFAYAKDGE